MSPPVPERFRLAAAVYGVLTRNDRVLLLRRTGSGYHDGELALPAGHLDGGEDAVTGLVRELAEELAIDVPRDACRLGLVLHTPPEDEEDYEYLHLLFRVARWRGRPVIGEPDRCTELVWVDPARPPADVVPFLAAALEALAAGEPLLLYGWPRD